MKKENQTILKSILMVTQIGISMLVPIFLCAFIGMKLDSLLNTEYCFVISVIVGILAAIRSVYLLTRRFYEKDLKREMEEQKYFDELMKNRKEKDSKDERGKRNIL